MKQFPEKGEWMGLLNLNAGPSDPLFLVLGCGLKTLGSN